MGSVLRISVCTTWGTAFCIDGPDGRVFHTAAHVLRDIGAGQAGFVGPVEMCDFSISAPSAVDVSVTEYDPILDVATFTCNFPAVPFLGCVVPPEGTDAIAEGYVAKPAGGIPNCGAAILLNGSAYHFVNMGGRVRGFLDLNASTRDLFGMSGAPITRLDEPNSVFGLLNGTASKSGGPPFIFTSI